MDWETINQRLNKLLEQNRLSELRGALLMINVVDIAQFMSELAPDKLLTVFRILPKDISADVFAYMPSDQQQVLIQSIGDSEIRSLMDEMFLDDTVDFLEELPASVVKRVLANTDEKTRSLINHRVRRVPQLLHRQKGHGIAARDRPGQGNHQHLLCHRRSAAPDRLGRPAQADSRAG